MGNSEKTLTDYQNGFTEFNSFINNIQKYKRYYEGYFVENQKYKEFYKQYEKLLSSEQKKLGSQGQQDNNLQILEQYKMNTEKVDFLKNNLLNNKEYIFINEGLYKLICEKNEEEEKNNLAKLYANDRDLIIYDKKEKPILVLRKNPNNIFNKSSISPSNNIVNSPQETVNNNNSINNTSNDNYNKMSQDIIDFFKNDRKVSDFLNSQSVNNYKGFLVDEIWVKNWKNYCKYEIIEANYLKNNFNEIQIKTNITNYLWQNKINNIYPDDVSPYILKDINQIKTLDKSFILLDENFVNTHMNSSNNKIKPNNFIISKSTIRVENPPLYFNTERNLLNKIYLSNSAPNNGIIPQSPNNNLTQPNNYNNNEEISQLLKHLLKYEYFKKEIFLPSQNFNIAYAIDYLNMKKLINMYNSKEIITNLNNQMNGLTYQNFNSYYQVILNNINKNNLKQPSIQEINNLRNELNNSAFLKAFNNQPNRLYIDNFVLIDQEFATFLLQKINNNIKYCQVFYKFIQNKIFIIVKTAQVLIYQISSFIDNETFVAEYIIYSNLPASTDISNCLLTLFLNYGLQNLVKMRMPIIYANNIQIYIYPINNNLNQIANVDKNNNFMKLGNNTNYGGINNPSTFGSDQIGARTTLSQSFSREMPTNVNNPIQLFRMSSAPTIPLNKTYIFNSDKNIDKVGNINSNNTNFDENVLLSIAIIKERQKLLSEIHSPNGNKNDQKKEYYLINKNYLRVISDKYNLEDLYLLISQNPSKNDTELLGIAKTNLNEKIKKEFNDLNKEDIQKILISKEKFGLNHYFVNNDKSTNLLYYKNCDIISEKLLELFKKIDKDINSKCQKVLCVFDNSIILIFINNYIINIANFDNEIFVKHIIISSGQNSSFNLSQIFNVFSQKGYEDFIKSFVISNNLINFKINQNYIVQASIYDINENGTLTYMPSDRLKTMLLLAVSQQFFSVNQKERVYLMSHEWLKDYKYDEIRDKIVKILNSRTGLWNTSYNFDSISTIIQLFGQEELKKYDEKVSKNRNISFLPSISPFELPNKYIDSYNKFVLINDKMYEHFKRSFGITFPNDNIFYIHKNTNIDYLCFQNYQTKNQYSPNNIQNYIQIGNINREENKFVVSYILDYNDKNIIEKEMQYFIQGDIQNYVQAKIGLTSQNDFYAPIFDNNQIIGYYYNVSKGFDPKKCVNYSNLLSNNQLWANIYLYYNELSISRKLKSTSFIEEEFYLINKNLLSVILTQNNYGQLKKYLNGKVNYNLPGQKDLYNIIKSLPQNDLKDLSNNLRPIQIQQGGINSYEIDIIPVQNPNNTNELYWILDNFELIEKTIANEYLKNKFPYHIMKCSILGNKTIVFHYPNNKFNNTKCMFLVSKIDEKNNFINDYLLLYDNPKYIAHFEQTKKNLNNYLSNQYYVNNTAPIVYGQGIQIGTIINLTGKQPPISSNTTITPTSPITSVTPITPTPGKEDEYFPPIPLSVTDSIQDFPSKPLIGLDNIGATCYMNATLQCLCNIKKFVDYFKYNKHLIEIVKNDTKKEKLCSAFKMVIENLYNYKISNSYKKDSKIKLKSSYPPRNFKDTISRMNPLFQGVAANDAKDLVNFLLMTLHAELNRALPETNNNMGNLLLDQRNQEFMFQIFADNFRKTNRSIISDLFYAMNCNKTQCGNCNSISYNYQIYFFLIFPLEEVRKFRLMYGGYNNNYPNNMVDIYDCFNYDQKISFMSGDNAMYCNYCKQTCPSNMCTLLTTGPEILIIILNRGQGIQFDVKINFYLELNLMNYIQLKETGCNYELFGVITHIGSSDMGGHFIAYCKSYFQNDYNKWYRFNDSLVTPVNDFQKEVIQFAMPYLLFYKKK